MAGGSFVGKFHNHRTQRSIEISSVLLTPQEVLVRLKGSPGSGCGYHGYSQRLTRLDSGMTWILRGGGREIRSKTGKGDDATAATDIDATDGRSAGGCASSAARA